MDYDIALKEMLRLCSREILQRWLGIPVSESAIIEDLPQETASLRRSDFPLHVITDEEQDLLILIEIQTRWHSSLPHRMLEYRSRHKLKLGFENIPTRSVLILLERSGQATDYYEDEQVHFQYDLIRVYEMDAGEIVQQGVACMAPLVPVMRGGEKWFRQADELIYKSDFPLDAKADMYTAMAIISGLTSRALLQQLLQRRQEIMIESAFFEVLKEEIEKEVREEAWEAGVRSGLLDSIAWALELKFGAEGLKLWPEIRQIEDIETLRAIQNAIRAGNTPDDVRAVYQGLSFIK